MSKQIFQETLTKEFEQLFTLPNYAMAKARYTPEELAAKFTNGLIDGSSSKDGDGVKRTCKKLGIKYTYSAIKQYLA